MKEYFLQISVPGLNSTKEKEQTIVNEIEINKTLEPASEAFSEFSEFSTKFFEIVADFIDHIFTYFL